MQSLSLVRPPSIQMSLTAAWSPDGDRQTRCRWCPASRPHDADRDQYWSWQVRWRLTEEMYYLSGWNYKKQSNFKLFSIHWLHGELNIFVLISINWKQWTHWLQFDQLLPPTYKLQSKNAVQIVLSARNRYQEIVWNWEKCKEGASVHISWQCKTVTKQEASSRLLVNSILPYIELLKSCAITGRLRNIDGFQQWTSAFLCPMKKAS